MKVFYFLDTFSLCKKLSMYDVQTVKFLGTVHVVYYTTENAFFDLRFCFSIFQPMYICRFASLKNQKIKNFVCCSAKQMLK